MHTSGDTKRVIAGRAAAMNDRNTDAGILLLLHVVLHDVVDIFMKSGECQINAIAHRGGGLRQDSTSRQQEDKGWHESRH